MRVTSLAPLALSLVSLAFTTAACSSSSGGAASDANGTGPGAGSGPGATTGGTACTSQAFAPTALEPGESLVDLAVGTDGPWLLSKGTDGARAVRGPNGERHVLAASGATGAAITTRSDGTVCALWGTGGSADAVVRTACAPTFDAVDTRVKMPISKDYPVAFRDDGDGGAAVLFAGSNSLDGIGRIDGEWSDAAMMESSISFAGGPRALSSGTYGAPLCFVINGTVVVERWNMSGGGNAFGRMKMDSQTTFYSDVGCAVAMAGDTLGVFAVGAGKAKLAMSPRVLDPQLGAAPLGQEVALDAQGILGSSFGATPSGFTAVYTTADGAFRARRGVSGGAPDVSPVALPAGAKATGPIAIAFDRAGAEHLAVQTASGVLYARTCPVK